VQTVELVIGPPVEPRADPIPIHFVDVGDLVNGVPTIRKQNRVRPHSTARRHIRLHDLLELLTLCFGERLDELRGSFHSPLILSQNLCLGAYLSFETASTVRLHPAASGRFLRQRQPFYSRGTQMPSTHTNPGGQLYASPGSSSAAGLNPLGLFLVIISLIFSARSCFCFEVVAAAK